ncbi:ubiquinol-cytochrome c reductase complex 6.7 kDa protein-like [Zingiber officinale]|uniref:ubiquinol-cytochrome c reductase complex 6.7 kDa protein-like n=1 Tax=Zingiber officinale TaxID=94328 RepID=UPI001C4AA015|nr:ubiquinol-cytochrome c reductase complex 6.7 kDa protein-like [Zingiber officinale]
MQTLLFSPNRSFWLWPDMAIGSAAAAGSGLFNFLRPRLRPQPTDVAAAATWGVAATVTALWLIQPFDWLKKQLFEKTESGS